MDDDDLFNVDKISDVENDCEDEILSDDNMGFFSSPGFAIKVLRLSRVCDQGSSALFGSAVEGSSAFFDSAVKVFISFFCFSSPFRFNFVSNAFFSFFLGSSGSFDSAVKVLHI
ncbi:uncharacterized protein OCT59_003253 [Rhizophagus irregularis]|uniref:uncharacterized protein n=1 Tax=Rhizophagus irregularis TaxID=588596 RepID=UPI00332C4D2F|nr:hypothetical protein OCT59_003253 [Rhizophagus irregularis]